MTGPKIVNLPDVRAEEDKILSDETADCLRKWLKLAEDGELISVALVGEFEGGGILTGNSAFAARPSILGALEFLKYDILTKIKEG